MSYERLKTPTQGEKIRFENGKFQVPDHVILPFIEGDGTGPDIWRASQRVFDGGGRPCIEGQAQGGLVRDLCRREGEQDLRRGDVASEGHAGRDPRLPGRDQGTAHDARRRGHPQPERRPAPGTRPLRLRAARLLGPRRPFPRARAGAAGRRDLPREHRGRLRGDRVGGGHAGGEGADRVHRHALRQEDPSRLGDRHQADLDHRHAAARPHGHPLRARARPQAADPRPQGEHHEVHRGGVP